jgi:hypothetical protein
MVDVGRGSGKLPGLTAALLGLLIAAGPASFAAASPEQSGAAAVAPPGPEPALAPAPAQAPAAAPLPLAERIDEAYAGQCVLIGELVGRIDDIFGEQYVSDRQRKVELRAGGEATLNNDGVGTDKGVNLGLRLPLPSLERRLNVFLDIGQDVTELGSASAPDSTERQKTASLAASLLGRLGENAEAGVKLSLQWDKASFASVYPFVRFEWLQPPMRYFLEQRLIWDTDNQWSTRTEFDVDRTLGGGYFLRWRNRADIDFGAAGAQVANGLLLRKSVLARSGLSYEVWAAYNTGPNDPATFDDDTIAYAQVRWTGRIWRNWLEYELRPVYTVPFESGRSPFFSFYVSLTVIWDSYLGGETPPAAAVPAPTEP